MTPTRVTYDLVDSIACPDDYTVEVTLSSPYAAFPDVLADPLAAVLPAAAFDGYAVMEDTLDPAYFAARRDLGAGPFLLGPGTADADRWRPWRTYALHHLWATL